MNPTRLFGQNDTILFGSVQRGLLCGGRENAANTSFRTLTAPTDPVLWFEHLIFYSTYSVRTFISNFHAAHTQRSVRVVGCMNDEPCAMCTKVRIRYATFSSRLFGIRRSNSIELTNSTYTSYGCVSNLNRRATTSNRIFRFCVNWQWLKWNYIPLNSIWFTIEL